MSKPDAETNENMNVNVNANANADRGDEATEEARDDPQQSQEQDVNAEIQADPSIRETLKDIGSRVPTYAQLSQRLVAEGMMTAGQQGQILGPLGFGPLSRVTRFVPLLGQMTRVLSMIGAIRFVLTQMNPEVADAHLAAVGLTREQVEADFRVTKDLSKRAGEVGAQHASRALEDGARVAGRLTGKGLRAFKNWQASNRGTPPGGDRSRRS